jgi:hypothetical protein
MTDRLLSLLFFGVAYCCGVAAMLILFVGFIDWLQTGSWSNLSVLELGYNAQLLKARWFLDHQWSWWMHDVLQWTPLYAFLLGLAPLAWLSGAWMARR